MKKTISLSLFLFLTSICNSQIEKIFSGVVEIGFQRDTGTFNHPIFWKTYERILIENDTLSLVLDISDIIGKIELVCQSDSVLKNTTWPDQRKSLYDLSFYQDQTIFELREYDVHYGGKVYQNPSGNSLVITFKINFVGIIYLNRPCEGFELESNYTCPISQKKKGYPLCVPIHIYKVTALRSREISKKGLFKFGSESFYWLECD